MTFEVMLGLPFLVASSDPNMRMAYASPTRRPPSASSMRRSSNRASVNMRRDGSSGSSHGAVRFTTSTM
eukprot:738858-Prymnesium_polylepis.1